MTNCLAAFAFPGSRSLGRKAGEREQKKIEGDGWSWEGAFPIFLRSLRSRLPAFRSNDCRESGTGYSSLAMVNTTSREQRPTDSVCIADDDQEFASGNENRKRNFFNFKK